MQPHGFDRRDRTIFKDDDGVAYLVYSSEDNSELHIGPLTDDYLDVTHIMSRILVGKHREAPAIFKIHPSQVNVTAIIRMIADSGFELHGEHIKELHGLNQLIGGFTIWGLRRVRDRMGSKEANLKDKPHLRSLKLTWWPSDWNNGVITPSVAPDEVALWVLYGNNEVAPIEEENVLEQLQPHQNIKKLIIEGYRGMKFASWMINSSLLPNLVKVDLVNCASCKSLDFSGPLPFLQVLRLFRLESLKNIISRLRKGEPFFPSLQHLELMHMPNLENWSLVIDDVNDGVAEPQESLSLFPLLPKQWSIINCPKLESIPWGMPAVEELKLNAFWMIKSLSLPNVQELKPDASWMIKSSLLPNLVKVELKDCLRCECLELLGPFPFLQVLLLDKLENLKNIISKLRKGEGFLPSLKHLQLMDMPNLEN
uniref:R13L1/DRL21-like LRR repeat region domain-containing protein n=2 Tax=Nelumbo nucifera TaxID=4432 RepID=A0A822YH45_NELNU|nr:TPA_asm: hypothetical protein HUJ06_031724 [Nelumbo nucifera]